MIDIIKKREHFAEIGTKITSIETLQVLYYDLCKWLKRRFRYRLLRALIDFWPYPTAV